MVSEHSVGVAGMQAQKDLPPPLQNREISGFVTSPRHMFMSRFMPMHECWRCVSTVIWWPDDGKGHVGGKNQTKHSTHKHAVDAVTGGDPLTRHDGGLAALEEEAVRLLRKRVETIDGNLRHRE